MKKLLKRLIILCIVIIVVYGILLIPRVDGFITEKINSLSTQNPISEYIITSPDTKDAINENPPFTYITDDKLFLLIRGSSIEISPDSEKNNEYKSDINDSLKYKRNCMITDEYIVYIAQINGEDTLFKLTLAEREITQIATKVDSFVITKQDNILYSTGYASFNHVYLYKDGISTDIAKNVKVYCIPEYDCLIFKGADGKLQLYSETKNKLETIDTDVEDIYNPFDETRNYMEMKNSFHFYYHKSTGDFVYTDGESQQFGSFENDIPKIIYKTSHDNRYYYYSEKENTLFLKDNDETFGIMRDVYNIFKYDLENERFIIATSKAVFLSTIGDTNRVNSIKLFNLSGIYKKNQSMVKNHMDITTQDYTTFYATKLAGSSFIFNFFNNDSWLNNISTYKYRLFVCNIKNSTAGKLNELDVPISNIKSGGFIQYDSNRRLYVTKNKKANGIYVSSITDGKLDIRKPFEKEIFDTITAYTGKDYIYFVTYSKNAEDKYMLYVYVNDIPILIHKGNFKVYNSYSSVYIVSKYIDEEEHKDGLYTISRVNSLNVEKIVNKAIIG